MNVGGRRSSCVFVTIALILLHICLSISTNDLSSNVMRKSTKKWTKKNECDMYQGSWIFDDSYPLYDSSTCPYIRMEFDCLKYGRPDREYLKYRWQPSHCDLPRFDGRDFLEKFKGKKIMFIGDSISLNQWESLLCLLHAAVPQTNVTQLDTELYTTVIFQDYGVSLMLFTSHYLVDIEKEPMGRILKLDSLKNGDLWKQMDVLVFNTWLWWYRRENKPWDYVQDGNTILKDMDRMEAFRKGLTTWAKWVDSSVDPKKTQVLFQGISPLHYNGKEWNATGVTDCGKETQPIKGSSYSAGLPHASLVVKDVLSKIAKPVHFLNITTLSQLRKDGHPSSYNGLKGMDCIHWCIAGVQDTWNQLFYTALVNFLKSKEI